jgi:hypothetical protein
MPSTIPDIVLPQGYVMLSQSASIQDLVMDNNSNLFGEVILVNDLCELYAVGDSVLFNPNEGIIMRYDIETNSYTYYFVREDSILLKENP